MRVRGFWHGLGWMSAGIGLAGLVLRAADIRLVVPVAQFALPAFGALAVLLAAAVAVTRLRSWLMVVSGSLAVTYLALAAVAAVPRTVDPRPDDLVVFTVNLREGRAEIADLEAQVRRIQPQVVVFTEATPEFAQRWQGSAVAKQYPHQVGRARPGGQGTLLLSREPFDVVDADANDLAYDQPTVRVPQSGRRVTIRAVHVRPPEVTTSDAWRRQLGWLERWRAGQPDDALMMIGDFKAGYAHPAFRDLSAGMEDAARQAGQGWQSTWPAHRALPFAGLDHVLVRGLPVVDYGTAGIRGTDHRAVWARVRTSG